MKKKQVLKEIEEKLIRMSIDIAKTGNGALFVIGEEVNYEKMKGEKLTKLNIFAKDAEKILKALAIIDGAVIIDKKGNLVEYGALIKKSRAFVGFGTRHAAALTASKNNKISILASEEERKVKIFKNGKYLMQIDALQKNIENKAPIISKILESAGVGVIGAIGTVVLVPTLGVTMIPGIIIFGGSYYAIKSFISKYYK